MERRLISGIMNPATAMTVGFGVWMIAYLNEAPGWWASSGSQHVKILLVALMLAVHVLLAKWRKDFESDRVTHSSRFFRVVNEGPELLIIGIAFFVIVQPL